MNVRLSYRYRDASGYKNINDRTVFSNPGNRSCEELEDQVRKNLIDRMWFWHWMARLPDMHFTEYAWDEDMDVDWHEFDGFEATDDPPNDEEGRTVDKLVEDLRKAGGEPDLSKFPFGAL